MERIAMQQDILQNAAALIGKKRSFKSLSGLNTKELD
jgi:hypothetical protein